MLQDHVQRLEKQLKDQKEKTEKDLRLEKDRSTTAVRHGRYVLVHFLFALTFCFLFYVLFRPGFLHFYSLYLPLVGNFFPIPSPLLPCSKLCYNFRSPLLGFLSANALVEYQTLLSPIVSHGVDSQSTSFLDSQKTTEQLYCLLLSPIVFYCGDSLNSFVSYCFLLSPIVVTNKTAVFFFCLLLW